MSLVLDRKPQSGWIVNHNLQTIIFVIEGEIIDGKYTIAYIPYYSINQNEVVTAYKSAKSMDKGTVILKSDGSYSGLCVSQWYIVAI